MQSARASADRLPRTDRAIAVLALALLVTAGFAGANSAIGASTNGSEAIPIGVFTDRDGVVTVLYDDGSTKGLGVTANVVGPMANLDDDRYLEAPIVGDSSDLRIVDTRGETRTLVSDDARKSKTYLAVGDWDDDGRKSVFYENTSNGDLWRVEYRASPRPVLGPDGSKIATNSPIGLEDYDGDGDEDIVFLGSSSTIKFYDGASIESTGFSSFGANNGIGLGAPVDFDGDGRPRVPYVTGSNNLALLAANGSKTKIVTNYGKAVKSPVAAANWHDDADLELLHVNTDGDELYVADLNGTVARVYDGDGSAIPASASAGIAPAAAPPAPDVTNYTVTNPTGRKVHVSFDASDELVDIAVEIDGPTDVTLTEGDFSESGSYHYEGAYVVPEDGNYTVTLTRAANARGIDGATNQSEPVPIRTAYPDVSNVSLTDSTDGNGIVADGNAVRVTARVENESALAGVRANVSAFGAGRVTLSSVGQNRYAATITVDASAGLESGRTSVAVTATNEYDHSDRSRGGDLLLDLVAPDADAGPKRVVDEGSTVYLDADGSTDNVRLARYVWTFENGTSVEGITTSKEYAKPGNYTVELTVFDAANHSGTDTVTVRVTNADVDNPPVADAGPNVTVEEGSTIVLDGDGSSDDREITRYVWTFENGATERGVSVKRTFPDPGTYTVSLTVYDSANHSDTDTLTVHVADVQGSSGGTDGTRSGDADDDGRTNPVEGTTGSGNDTDATGGGTGTDTGSGDSRVLTSVTSSGATVDVTVRDATANRPISIALGNRTVTESTVIRRIEIVPLRSGNFSLTIRGLKHVPDAVPGIENRTGMRPLGYFRIDHTIANENLRGVELTVVVPRGRIDVDGGATVSLYRYHGGEWSAYEADVVGNTSSGVKFRSRVPGLSVFGVVAERPALRVVRATLAESTVDAGDSGVVRATVRNDGKATGTRRVTLVANGTVLVERSITLAPNETRTITFAEAFARPGTYRLRVEDVLAGTLVVQNSTAPESAPATPTSSTPRVPTEAAVGAMAVTPGTPPENTKTAPETPASVDSMEPVTPPAPEPGPLVSWGTVTALATLVGSAIGYRRFRDW